MNTEVQISDKIAAAAFSITVTLDTDATPEQAEKQINALCAMIGKNEVTLKHARILLGRMMAAVQDRKLYKPAHATFEAFTQALCDRHRLSRPTLRRALRFVRNVPDMLPAEAEEIPMENLNLLAQVAPKAEPRQLTLLRKEAPKLGIVEFRARVVNMALVKPQGRPSASEARRGPVVLKLLVPAALRRRYGSERGSETDAKFLARLLDLVKSDHLKAA